MRKIIVGLIVLLSLMFSTQAVAAGKNYFGVDFSMVEAELGTDLDLGVATIGVGTYLNDIFAIEGRLGFGIDDDTASDFSASLTMDLDYMFGAYIRAVAPLERIKPYLIAGYTHAEVEFSGEVFISLPPIPTGPFSVSDDESDFSYGFGVDFLVGENAAINAEYMQLIDTSDIEVEAVSLGAKFFF